MKVAFFVAVLAHLVACGGAEPRRATPARAFVTDAGTPPPPATSRLAYELARSLADEVGPRPSGSPGDPRAVAWAERAMQRVGLERVRTEPVVAPAWQRGEERAEILSPAAHQLAVTALGWSPATSAGGLDGEVVEVDSIDTLKALPPAQVRGKIVFYNRPIPRQRDGKGYGEGVQLRSAGPAAAGALGAIAALVRSVGTDHDRAPHTGVTRDATIPAAAVAIADAELLHRLGASGKPVHVHLLLTPHPLGNVRTSNVVGDLVGASKPSEIVLLGAHLDSWDLASGAVDDGAGCGIVLAAADAIGRGQRPARTVRVVLYAAEENSGAGGRAYAAAHAAEVGAHVLAFEADTGSGAAWAFRFAGDASHRRSFLAAAPRVAAYGVVAETENAWGGSDIGPLRALGVPVMDVRQDMTRYFDVHHTANDTVMELDAAALGQVSGVVAELVRFAADAPSDFGRIPVEARARD